MRDLYKRIYKEKLHNYGEAEFDMCPAVRYMPLYFTHIKDSSFVYDFGAGTGDTVRKISELGIACIGFEWAEVKARDVFNEDITLPLEKHIMKGINSSAICIDVFEHINDAGLDGLCRNLQLCRRQVISVHCGSSVVEGVELHINIKTPDEWKEFIQERFNIVYSFCLDNTDRIFYLTESK